MIRQTARLTGRPAARISMALVLLILLLTSACGTAQPETVAVEPVQTHDLRFIEFFSPL